MNVEALTVNYQSPAQGEITMGWDGPVLRRGVEFPLTDYPRYDNPWSAAGFPGSDISFQHGDSYLNLNFDTPSREASDFID